jgi:signal transduction histidine kinase
LGRRLFWKVYLTLLASLVLVAMLVGVAWRFTGDRVWGRWHAFRVHMADIVIPAPAEPRPELIRAVRRLSRAVGADVSIYGSDRQLLVSEGEAIPLPPGDDDGGQGWHDRVIRVDLQDGRTLLARLNPPPPDPGLRILLLVLLVAGGVGLAAYPLTARLTRRLENLRSGVESWGQGSLSTRVPESGRDEVAQVARTFNAAAARIEALLLSQRALLANASHELRSPLARLRLAVEMRSASDGGADAEIAASLSEIDGLVGEILLASRLEHDAPGRPETLSDVDLLGLAAEEAAALGGQVSGEPVEVRGDATLLRRLLRNLIENAVKHGAPPVEVTVSRGEGKAVVRVVDKGQGVPAGERESVFEPFYRPSGRSEGRGGWGLGLSLVRQIADRHAGNVRCEEGSGGGTVFVVELPLPEGAPRRSGLAA